MHLAQLSLGPWPDCRHQAFLSAPTALGSPGHAFLPGIWRSYPSPQGPPPTALRSLLSYLCHFYITANTYRSNDLRKAQSYLLVEKEAAGDARRVTGVGLAQCQLWRARLKLAHSPGRLPRPAVLTLQHAFFLCPAAGWRRPAFHRPARREAAREVLRPSLTSSSLKKHNSDRRGLGRPRPGRRGLCCWGR